MAQTDILPPTLGRQQPVSASVHLTAAPPPSLLSEYESLTGLLRILRRRWVAVATVSASLIVLGAAVTFLITPRFSATTTIEVNEDNRAESITARDPAATAAPGDLKSEIQTAISILESEGLALAVIHDLQLIDKHPFRGAILSSEKGRPLEDAPRTRERMVKLFERDLKVDSPTDTRLIDITYRNPDPAIAAAVANTLAARFMEDTLERRHRSVTQSSFWLRKELDDLKQQVSLSEQKLADYERKTGLAGIQLTGASTGDGASTVAVTPHNTVTERLFSLNQELTAAEANRISAETVYRLVQSQDPEVVLGLGAMSVSTGSGAASGSLTSDAGIELLRGLRAQEATLSRDYAAAAVKYGTNNARLIQLQQQVEALRQQMQAELSRIARRAENAYLYAKRNEDTIRAQFIRQQSAANLMADSTVQLQVLAQEAYSNRALYESLFSKLQTASLASGVRATRIDVVDQARPAGSPSTPEYGKYLALVVSVSLFLGISTAFLSESLDETIRTPHHLEEIPDLPLLGYIPTLPAARLPAASRGVSQLIADPMSPFSESFRALRTALLSNSIPRGGALLITSALGGDGKTTVACNLGVAFAQQGSRVLLIDGDLRNPDLHRQFGCPRSPGLGDLMTSILVDHQNIVPHATLPNLHILPAGLQLSLPAEFFGSAAFDTLLRQYSADYDLILIDSPPILSVTDASIIAGKVAGIVAVVRSHSTTRPALSDLAQSLHRTRMPVLGFVLNGVRQPLLDGFHHYSYTRAANTAQTQAA